MTIRRCSRPAAFLCLALVVALTGCDDDEPVDPDAAPTPDAAQPTLDGAAGPEPDVGDDPEPDLGDDPEPDLGDDPDPDMGDDPDPDMGAGECVTEAGEGLRPAAFVADGLAAPIEQVDCTLDDGTATTCHRVVLRGAPANHDVGPFCPRTIDDTADAVGIWVESGEVYDVDGAFVTGLADFYGDPNWQLYDPDTGEVNVTLTAEACDAAARPNVAPEYQNHCVECLLEWFDGGIEAEYLIPVTPVARANPAEIGGMSKVGVALSGVVFDPPAPTDAILSAYTIAAFDDCGGHVNPATGYHYHAATGCTEESQPQCDGHPPLIGYALDGYGIYAMAGDDGVEPDDLDACRGHTDAVRGYHYHAASPGENMFIGCLNGHIAGEAGDGGGPGMGGMEPAPCADGQMQRCCGDGVCDGPETAQNCAEDC